VVFGAERTDVGTIAQTDFGYTGQRLLDDGMGGLMDYQARMYLPYLNRFTQPDSIVPDLSNPQALNRYSYALNYLIRYNDPSGHCSVCAAVLAVLGGMAIGLVVDLAYQGYNIYTEKQDQFDWGQLAGATIGGGFFAGAIVFAAPVIVGTVSLLSIGAIAGALAGQISIFTEAVADEAIADKGNYNTPDVGRASIDMGFMNPKQITRDAIGGAVSVGVGNELRQIGINTGLISTLGMCRLLQLFRLNLQYCDYNLSKYLFGISVALFLLPWVAVLIMALGYKLTNKA